MTTRSLDLLSHMDSLLKLPSISSANSSLDMSNKPVVDYLAEQFSNLGFSCELVPCNPDPNKFNLIASYGSGPGGLVLAGHTDTVPIDEELWTVDPFAVTEKDGRLYGLGATDMKGFFAVVLEAVLPMLEGKFKEPLIILATADEETSMQGARTLAELGRPKARTAIIGEPTGLQAVRAHKGIMMDRIKLLGQSGHSSNPALGNNALDAMHQVIGELMQFREKLKNDYHSDLFEIPYPTLNLGVIHGGDNPNRICGHCDLEFDVRLTPGLYSDTVREEICRRVHAITEPLGIQFELESLFAGVPAFFTEDNSALLKTAEELTGHAGISVAFATEGPYLQQLGMDTIILGPGHIDQAHQPDEYMDLNMIDPCIKLLRQLITRYCLT